MDKTLKNKSGIIIINKEKGYTSHDVVARLRGILHIKRIGHTGTLDPDAVGVLPICVGKATKVCDLISGKEKKYIARVKLGIETDTYDMSGKILEENSVEVGEKDIQDVLSSFRGEIKQIPPMYSAIKVNGKKLYEIARNGQEIERKARKITIYSLEIINFNLEENEFDIEVVCSKGTYIRSLCKDIGDSLGCKAAMKELLRSRVGNFSIENSLKLDQVEKMVAEGKEVLRAVDDLFQNIPSVYVKENGEKLLNNGNPIPFELCEKKLDRAYVNENEIENEMKNMVRMYNFQGIFYGLFKEDKKKQVYKVEKLLI